MRRGMAGTQSQALLLSASLAALAMFTVIPSTARAADESAAPAPKVLRYAIREAETGFDPVQVTDLYSRNVTAAIFDAPLRYSFLGRPYRLEPNVTDGMPEVSDDYKRFVFRIKPGIYFADDPAFNGKQARAGGRGPGLHRQAPLRPAQQERPPLSAGGREDPRPVRSCAPRR